MNLVNKCYGFDGEIQEQEYMSEEFGGEESTVQEVEYMSEEFGGEESTVQEVEYMSDDWDVEEGTEQDGEYVSGGLDIGEEYIAEEGPRVLFGNITPVEANVSPTSVWNVVDKNLGLFFIVDANKEVLSKEIKVLTKDNVQIWSSPIKKLPKYSLELEGIEGDIYISAKAINRVELEEEVNGNYFVTVDDSEVQSMVLKIEGLSKSDNLVEEDDSWIESDGEGNLTDVSEKDLELISKSIVLGDNDKVSEVDHGLEVLRVGLNSGSFTSRVVKKDENGNVLNLFVPRYTNPEDSVWFKIKGADIVIEKINNKYLVTLNNIAKRPIQLFDGECPYFIHGENIVSGDNIKEFIDKIKAIVCRTYGLDSAEFDEMQMDFISDTLVANAERPIRGRSAILNELPIKKGHAVIDLDQDGCDIYYCTGKDVIVVSCFDLGEKELVKLYEDLNGLVKLLGRENVDLIGLAANEEVANILKIENDDCVINTIAKFARMQ